MLPAEKKKILYRLCLDENSLLIHDKTEVDHVNQRRMIYLTIQSSLSADECVHKLIKSFGNDSQEKTYVKFYGSISETFCKLSTSIWVPCYLTCFDEYVN